MILSPEQLEALNRGEAVTVTVDNTQLIVVRKDLYQTMRHYDDSDWTDDEMERLAAGMFDGLDDPEKIRP